MSKEVVIGKEELVRKFRKMKDEVKSRGLRITAEAGGSVILIAAKGNLKQQGLRKTSHLAGSLHEEVSQSSPTQAAVSIGTNVEHAAIHEFGGTIKPKSAKYLAIPVGTYKGSPLKHPNLRVRLTNAGNLVMVDSSGAVQYVLKTSVEIPARPYLRPAFDEHKQDALDVMEREFRSFLLKAAKA